MSNLSVSTASIRKRDSVVTTTPAQELTVMPQPAPAMEKLLKPIDMRKGSQFSIPQITVGNDKDRQIVVNCLVRTSPLNAISQSAASGIRKNAMNIASESFLQESADTGRPFGGWNVPDYLDMQRRSNSRRMAQFGGLQSD